jgi:hypothetical protein
VTELLIVAVLGIIVVGGAAFVLAETHNKLLARSEAQLTSMMQLQRARNRLGEDLRGARLGTVSCTDADPALTSPLRFTPAGAGGVPVAYWRSEVGASEACPSCCVDCLMRYQGPAESPFQPGAGVVASHVTTFERTCPPAGNELVLDINFWDHFLPIVKSAGKNSKGGS